MSPGLGTPAAAPLEPGLTTGNPWETFVRMSCMETLASSRNSARALSLQRLSGVFTVSIVSHRNYRVNFFNLILSARPGSAGCFSMLLSRASSLIRAFRILTSTSSLVIAISVPMRLSELPLLVLVFIQRFLQRIEYGLHLSLEDCRISRFIGALLASGTWSVSTRLRRSCRRTVSWRSRGGGSTDASRVGFGFSDSNVFGPCFAVDPNHRASP